MAQYLTRINESALRDRLKAAPVVAVTGPRQCGKSTLVKHLLKRHKNTLYLDLERPTDLEKLALPELFLQAQKGKLICIDEIQRKPELFPLIRSLVDEWQRPGCFLILGSASRELLKQSSESLAGRISYNRLTPFLLNELPGCAIADYLTCGGFPRSILADNKKHSYEWRQDFIATFLERDLLQWAGFTPTTMRRLWKMLAHLNGQTVNFASLGSSLNISATLARHYIDLLTSTYMTDLVEPYFSNMKKRLVKAPKVYIADSGLANALLEIRSYTDLTGHPSIGAVWESVVLANLRGWYPAAEIFYYRTSAGAEVDFILKFTGKVIALECKVSSETSLSKGNYFALEDIMPNHTFVVTPSGSSWPMRKNIEVVSLKELRYKLRKILS
ncbi:putative AAA family ATPase [Candidatus Termititenax aidoneus]|uniref:AAA family ATPase n=1 Tax=Termititenax aidoneus TaxID=2218524 RepID=A0A388TDD0_TERA1|nr:putative AAA family ATPase [Candidatus Termititenax aidoneus]